MATEYQREQARIKARKAGKVPASDKKKVIYKSPKTNRQKAQDEIKTYKMKYYGKPSTSTQPVSTATSGGSKAVRKVTTSDSGDTDLVKRLRKKPFKYIK